MSNYDVFAADYDAWAAEMTEDVAWYVELAREAPEPIVELAVGTGRVTIPIARETGKRVIGIDRSPAMLAVGRERAAGLPIELREADIRELELESPVDLVICPFRSLQPRGSGLWEIVHHAPADNRIELTRGRSDETIGVLRIWWVAKSEWEGLLEVAGLEVEALYGWFDRRPLTDESRELVWVARKPG
jgi:SAM-dependent methyltransferase